MVSGEEVVLSTVTLLHMCNLTVIQYYIQIYIGILICEYVCSLYYLSLYFIYYTLKIVLFAYIMELESREPLWQKSTSVKMYFNCQRSFMSRAAISVRTDVESDYFCAVFKVSIILFYFRNMARSCWYSGTGIDLSIKKCHKHV